MARARNDFTKRDDKHLIEYIALHNPDHRGRQGNNLYKTLEENANGEWPWSANHPWQAWRERYRKNQDWFDDGIKRYLKKLRRIDIEGKGSKQESENKQQVKDTSEAKQKLQVAKGAAEGVVMDRQPKIEKVEKTRSESVVRRSGDVPQKSREAIVAQKRELSVEKVARKEKSTSRREERVGEAEQRRTVSADVSQMEEIPDSEDVALEMHLETDREDDLMLELFGPSEDEDDGESPVAHIQDMSKLHNSPSKTVVNIVPSEPVSSLSSGPKLSQFPPQSSDVFATTSQRPSQKSTPPRSYAEYTANRQPRSSSPPSPSYPAPTPGQRPRVRSSSTSSESEPRPTLQEVKAKAKHKLKKKPVKNIFDTPTSTPSSDSDHSDLVTPKREPVIVVEGPFRTTLKRPRQVHRDSDSDEGRRWPPKRSKTSPSADAAGKSAVPKGDGVVKPSSKQQPPQETHNPKISSKGEPSHMSDVTRRVEAKALERPRPVPAQQVNAIASSSKMKLPDVPPPNAPSNSKNFISEKRQGGLEAPDRQNPPPSDNAIAGRNAPIPIPVLASVSTRVNPVQAVEVPSHSRVQAQDQISSTAVRITNAKGQGPSLTKEGKGEGSVPSASHVHTDLVGKGPQTEGIAISGLSKSNRTTIDVPVPIRDADFSLSTAPASGSTLPIAAPALVPRPIPNEALGVRALPTKAAHANDPFTSISANATPTPKMPLTALDKGKARASEVDSKPPRKIDLHRQSLTKAKRPRSSVSLNSSVNRPSRPTSALSARESLLSVHSRTSTATSPSNSLLQVRLSNSRLPKSRISAASSRRSSVSLADLQRELDPEEAPRFAETAALETAAVLKELADTYGVSVKIAIKTYIRNRTLEATEWVLQQFYQELAEKEKVIYTRMPPELLQGVEQNEEQEQEGDEEEEVPEGLIPNSHRASLHRSIRLKEDSQTPEHTPRQSIKSTTSSVSPRRRPRSSMLSIKPLTAEDHDLPLSDYSPPNSSRAGQFARLEKQGRREEALAREKKRASGIHPGSTQVPSEAEVVNQEFQDHMMVDGSPSPSPKDPRMTTASVSMELKGHQSEREPLSEPVQSQRTYMQSDDDSMYAHTDDEFAKQMVPTQDKMDVEPEVENSSNHANVHEGIDADQDARKGPAGVSMPVSPAAATPIPEEQSQSKSIYDLVDEIAAANPTLARKHRALAFNVTPENAAEMRKFEAQNDSMLLRFLSIKWASEFLNEGFRPREIRPSDE